MNGGHEEDALAVRKPEVGGLNHDGEGLRHKDAAHHGKHQLLTGNDRHRSETAAKRERAHVAHEDLRRMRVEPEEGESRARERTRNADEFARARDVGEDQVGGEVGASDHIGEDAQSHADQHGREDGEAVKAVREIHGIARAHDHDVREDHEADQPEGERNVLEARNKKMNVGREVEREARVVPLRERLGEGAARFNRERERKVEGGDEPDHGLPAEFLLRAHASGVVVHDLAVVVDPADRAVAERNEKHDPDEAVREIRPEES